MPFSRGSWKHISLPGSRREGKKERKGGKKKAGNSPASERSRGTNHACFRVKPVAISKPDTTLVRLALALFPPSLTLPPRGLGSHSLSARAIRGTHAREERGGESLLPVVSTPAAKSRAAPCNDDELALLRHYSVPLDTIVRTAAPRKFGTPRP